MTEDWMEQRLAALEQRGAIHDDRIRALEVAHATGAQRLLRIEEVLDEVRGDGKKTQALVESMGKTISNAEFGWRALSLMGLPTAIGAAAVWLLHKAGWQ